MTPGYWACRVGRFSHLIGEKKVILGGNMFKKLNKLKNINKIYQKNHQILF